MPALLVEPAFPPLELVLPLAPPIAPLESSVTPSPLPPLLPQPTTRQAAPSDRQTIATKRCALGNRFELMV
jgi:hypothetical protein